MKHMGCVALFALMAAALVIPGAMGESVGRKMLTVATPKQRLVSAQVHMDKKLYNAQATQQQARTEAISTVSKTLDQAARKEQRLNTQVDVAASKAAELAARAAANGSIGTMKRAAIAEVNVEKAIRQVEQQKDQLGERVDKKIDNALDKQARQEDRAANQVDNAQVRLIKAQAGFDRHLARKADGAIPPAFPIGGALEKGPARGL